MTRKDLIACIVLGEVSAGIAYALATRLAFPLWLQFVARFSFVAIPLGAVAVVWIASRYRQRWPSLLPAGKFGIVGCSNTLIDLATLNLFILATGVVLGPLFALFKAASFLVAVLNSYFWNRHWAFACSENSRESGHAFDRGEFGLFLVVTTVGLAINTAAASLLVTLQPSLERLSGVQWANLAAVGALVLSTMWNFFAYRYVVFSSSATGAQSVCGVWKQGRRPGWRTVLGLTQQ